MAAKKEAKKEKEKEEGLVVVEEEGRRDMVRFAQRAEARGDRQVQVGDGIEAFQGLGNFK
jgi:hypothetical protein